MYVIEYVQCVYNIICHEYDMSLNDHCVLAT